MKKTIHIHNPHPHPIAFKVKTTAPKQYCVRPNSGRVEVGETVEVLGECLFGLVWFVSSISMGVSSFVFYGLGFVGNRVESRMSGEKKMRREEP